MKCALNIFLAACAILVALSPGDSFAQSRVIIPPVKIWRLGQQTKDLVLTEMDVKVEIDAFMARTAMTLTFTNNTNAVIEGELYFTLPEGATVCDYALDIGPKMVEGVSIKRQRGTAVFNAISRKRVVIDPGLMEWVDGKTFKNRVYPFFAGRSRTIRVSYVAPVEGPPEAPRYRLPLQKRKMLDKFSVSVSCRRLDAKPRFTTGGFKELEFKKRRGSSTASITLENFVPTDDLVLELPETPNPQVIVEEAGDDEFYFAVSLAPDQPVTGRVHSYRMSQKEQDEKSEQKLKKVIVPKKVHVIWDASGSRSGDHTRELALLREYLESLPEVGVNLYLLRDELIHDEEFRIKGNAGDLIKHLEAINYDGGTRIETLDERAFRNGRWAELCLIFTDGESTLAGSITSSLGVPAWIFSGTARANELALQRLAAINHGLYFNLAREKVKGCVAQIGQPNGLAFEGVLDIWEEVELAEKYPFAHSNKGRKVIAGRLDSSAAKILLSFSNEGTLKPFRLAFSRRLAAKGNILKTLWGQQRLASLRYNISGNSQKISDIGKEFGLVTPLTSLIVLESLSQYRQYGVDPPASILPKNQQKHSRYNRPETTEKEEKEEQLKDLLQQVRQRRIWWNKKPRDFEKEQQEKARKASEFARYAPGGGMFGGGMRGAAGGGSGSGMGGFGGGMGGMGGGGRSSRNPFSLGGGMGGGSMFGGGMGGAGGASFSEPNSLVRTSRNRPVIQLKAWNSDQPYIDDLENADPSDRTKVYMEHRKTYKNSPSFYLECARFFRQNHHSAMAVRVLTNLAELQTNRPELLRVMAWQLLQWNETDLAIEAFEEVFAIEPENPNSHRDLANALIWGANSGSGFWNKNGMQWSYRRAAQLLYDITLDETGSWDSDYSMIALNELNHLFNKINHFNRRIAKFGGDTRLEVRAEQFGIDSGLIKMLDVDIRIVLSGMSRDESITLEVIEPDGEKADSVDQQTPKGGLISASESDSPPIEYMVRNAQKGIYKIRASYSSSDSEALLGAIPVHVDIFTNYGRPNEQRRSIMVLLDKKNKEVEIGEVTMPR